MLRRQVVEPHLAEGAVVVVHLDVARQLAALLEHRAGRAAPGPPAWCRRGCAARAAHGGARRPDGRGRRGRAGSPRRGAGTRASPARASSRPSRPRRSSRAPRRGRPAARAGPGRRRSGRSGTGDGRSSGRSPRVLVGVRPDTARRARVATTPARSSFGISATSSHDRQQALDVVVRRRWSPRPRCTRCRPRSSVSVSNAPCAVTRTPSTGSAELLRLAVDVVEHAAGHGEVEQVDAP